MNAFSNLLLEKFQLFSTQHPTLGLLGMLLGALVMAVVALFRINFMLQEKAISLNTQRFGALMDVLQADNAKSANPLYLELAFQKAFRRKQSRDEIVFALRHRNPTSMLFDMWHGRLLVKLNPERTCFILRKNHFFSLHFRERVLDAALFLFAAPGFMLAFIYTFFNPMVGLVFLVEFGFFFWILLDSGRAVACARRLIDTSYDTELRTT